MDTSGQAAEQIVRYSIEGMEYTLKLAGKGAEHLAAMLMALNRAEQKTRGHTTLRALLKSGKPLKQIFERWEDKETSHMENIWDTVQEQTKAAEAKQKAKAQKER